MPINRDPHDSIAGLIGSGQDFLRSEIVLVVQVSIGVINHGNSSGSALQKLDKEKALISRAHNHSRVMLTDLNNDVSARHSMIRSEWAPICPF